MAKKLNAAGIEIALAPWRNKKLARLRVIKAKKGIEIQGIADKEIQEDLENFADRNGVELEVKFRSRMLTLPVEINRAERSRIQQAAGHLGLSDGAYLRLCESLCAGDFLSIWQAAIDHRARMFVESGIGIGTKRLGLSERGGIERVQKKLSSLTATPDDAMAAVRPGKELRENWGDIRFQGDAEEQALAKMLFSDNETDRENAYLQIKTKLADTFYGSVQKYKQLWALILPLREAVAEKYQGLNRDLYEGFKRDITFINQLLSDLKRNKPVGYRRWRMLGSELPSLRHPSGRGYGRWRKDLFNVVGGLDIYYQAREIKMRRGAKRSTRRAILKNGLIAWRKRRRKDLSLKEKHMKNDDMKLASIKSDTQVWFDPKRLSDLLAGEPQAANLNRVDTLVVFPPRPVSAVLPRIKVQPEGD